MPRFKWAAALVGSRLSGAAQAGFGLVVLAQRIVGEGDVHIGRQGLGLQSRGGLELRHRFRHLAARHVEIAEVVVRRHVVGARLHRIHQLGHRAAHPAALFLGQPVLGNAGQGGGGAHAHQAVIIAGRLEQRGGVGLVQAFAQRFGDARPHQRRGIGHQLPQHRPFVVGGAVGQQPNQRDGLDFLAVRAGEISEDVRQLRPVLLARGGDQGGAFEHRFLVIALAPFAHELVGPGGVLVGVAEIAGVGRLVERAWSPGVGGRIE